MATADERNLNWGQPDGRKQIQKYLIGMTISSLIDRIFTLPPVEKRRMVGDPLRRWIFPNYTKESNDTYIYYLTFKYSFIVSLLFSFLNWVSYTWGIEFNFLLFKIAIPKEGFNEAFLFSYSFYTTGILWAIILPFYWIMFRKNVDWKNFDPTWTATEDQKRKMTDTQIRLKADISTRLKFGRRAIFLLLFTMPFLSVGWYWPYKRFYLYESYGYFLYSLMSLPIMNAIFCYGFMILFTAYQRYKHNPDQE